MNRGHGTCDDCRFAFRPELSNDQGMHCRRHAPTVLLVGMNQSTLVTGGQTPLVPITQGFFPPVTSSIWCGEWEPRLVEVN